MIKTTIDTKAMIFRVIIAGSRDFGNYGLLKKKLDIILSRLIAEGYTIIIVSGGARGADTLGEWYAKERGFAIERYIPNWAKDGKGAGYIRNERMAEVADALVAFWDEQSRGTEHMINFMLKLHKLVRIIRYKKYQ